MNGPLNSKNNIIQAGREYGDNIHPEVKTFSLVTSPDMAPGFHVLVYTSLPIHSKYFNMTQLLTHTVAHSTRPSFRLKTNNLSTKKFFSLVVTWVKVFKMCKILTFTVNFLCQKGFNIYKKSLKNIICWVYFLLLTFFDNFIF